MRTPDKIHAPWAAALVCLIFIPMSVIAQPDTVWTRNHPLNWPVSVISTADGGFALSGMYANHNGENGRRDTDFALVKTDSNGDLEWRGYYAGLAPGDTVHRTDFPYTLRQMPDEGFVLAGAGAGGAYPMMVRTDSDGNAVWMRVWPRDVGFSRISDCAVGTDGNIVIVYYSTIAKISDAEEGEIIWLRQTNNERLGKIINVREGGYLIGGQARGDRYACKINEEGDIEWENIFGTREYGDVTSTLLERISGGYAFTGGSHFGIGADSMYASLSYLSEAGEHLETIVLREIGTYNYVYSIVEIDGYGFALGGRGSGRRGQYGGFWVTRITYDGEPIWQRGYVRGVDECTGIKLMEDGGYVLGGGGLEGLLIRTEPDIYNFPMELEPLEETHDFEEVYLDSAAIWELLVHNPGRRPAVVDSVAMEDPYGVFSCSFDSARTIGLGDTATFGVSFQPQEETIYSARLLIWFGDDSLEISLTGRGRSLYVPLEGDLVAEFTLHPPYPNPFNSAVSIHYSLPEASDVRLALYDLSGREVSLLAVERREAGRHFQVFNGDEMASGIYFLRLEANGIRRSQKLMLLK